MCMYMQMCVLDDQLRIFPLALSLNGDRDSDEWDLDNMNFGIVRDTKTIADVKFGIGLKWFPEKGTPTQSR